MWMGAILSGLENPTYDGESRVGVYFGIAGLNPGWVPSATRRSWSGSLHQEFGPEHAQIHDKEVEGQEPAGGGDEDADQDTVVFGLLAREVEHGGDGRDLSEHGDLGGPGQGRGAVDGVVEEFGDGGKADAHACGEDDADHHDGQTVGLEGTFGQAGRFDEGEAFAFLVFFKAAGHFGVHGFLGQVVQLAFQVGLLGQHVFVLAFDLG